MLNFFLLIYAFLLKISLLIIDLSCALCLSGLVVVIFYKIMFIFWLSFYLSSCILLWYSGMYFVSFCRNRLEIGNKSCVYVFSPINADFLLCIFHISFVSILYNSPIPIQTFSLVHQNNTTNTPHFWRFFFSFCLSVRSADALFPSKKAEALFALLPSWISTYSLFPTGLLPFFSLMNLQICSCKTMSNNL